MKSVDAVSLLCKEPSARGWTRRLLLLQRECRVLQHVARGEHGLSWHSLSPALRVPTGWGALPRGEKGEKCRARSPLLPESPEKPSGPGAAAGVGADARGGGKRLDLTPVGSGSSTALSPQWGRTPVASSSSAQRAWLSASFSSDSAQPFFPSSGADQSAETSSTRPRVLSRCGTRRVTASWSRGRNPCRENTNVL